MVKSIKSFVLRFSFATLFTAPVWGVAWAISGHAIVIPLVAIAFLAFASIKRA